MRVNDVLRGHSKAMYSTWFHYKPDSLLFDCGEGVALTMNTQVYGVDTILLSHGHLDHIMGLPGFFFTRSAAKGDKLKPLRIVHPKGDPDIPRLKDFIGNSFLGPHALKFPVTWVEAEPDQFIEVGPGRCLKTFATCHDEARLTLGYELREARKKLKPEYADLPGLQIKEMVLNDEPIFDYTPRKVLVYTGDTTVQDLEVFEDTELVMHEATFLNREDVKYDSHSLLEDVLAVMAGRQPRELLLMHFSTRYSPAMCGAAVRIQATELRLTFPIWVQYGEYCWMAYDPEDLEQEPAFLPDRPDDGSEGDVFSFDPVPPVPLAVV